MTRAHVEFEYGDVSEAPEPKVPVLFFDRSAVYRLKKPTGADTASKTRVRLVFRLDLSSTVHWQNKFCPSVGTHHGSMQQSNTDEVQELISFCMCIFPLHTVLYRYRVQAGSDLANVSSSLLGEDKLSISMRGRSN